MKKGICCADNMIVDITWGLLNNYHKYVFLTDSSKLRK